MKEETEEKRKSSKRAEKAKKVDEDRYTVDEYFSEEEDDRVSETDEEGEGEHDPGKPYHFLLVSYVKRFL